MISSETAAKINGIAEKYGTKISAILPALRLVGKEKNGTITSEDIQDLSDLFQVPVGEVRSIVTFYSLFHVDTPIGTYHLQVDLSVTATLMGAERILAYLEKKLGIKAGETSPDGRFTLSKVDDLGSGGTCPVVRVNSVYYENMSEEKVDRLIDSLKKGVMPSNEAKHYHGTACGVLLKNRGVENSTSIETYKKTGGYEALEKARGMKPEAIIDEVRNSGIRGRGGAGFPTGEKWAMIPRHQKKPVYLICNADEGEPGTFKDRQIMEYDPHLLLEGMAIAAHAIGAELGFIYIRGEFAWIADILETAIAEAKADGWLAGFDIIVHRGGGSYVCGEETALIESLEGKRGHPRAKPPFPAAAGLYGCPTIVNNVETLASVPFIIGHGSEAFKKWGFPDNYGFKLFAVSGHVKHPGVYEYPIGVPFQELLVAAGGVTGNLKAAIVGGLSTPILTAAELDDLTMDYESCKQHGTSLGSRGIIVMSEGTFMPQLALSTAEFYTQESCGKCTPCREGTHVITAIIKKIVDGHGSQKDIDKIIFLTGQIQELGSCPVGRGFSYSLKTMVEKFRGEFEKLLSKKSSCPKC